ncbi:MAG: hypothetical protein N2Z80_06675 [Hydrogenothermaceae bacterium]|nr:hypothetical protein [Hydrogenothermaceae bacterium]
MKFMLLLFLLCFSMLSKAQNETPIRTEPIYITNQPSGNGQEEKNYSVYRVYAFGVALGEVYFSMKEGKIEARGQTYKSLRFLYSYDFVYLDQGDYKALYEKEKEKERIYQNKEVYEKRPWLPIIAMFFRDGSMFEEKVLNAKILINNAPVLIEKSEDELYKIFHFITTQSKTKRISVYLKRGEILPYRIDIEGKTEITLEKITPQ